MKAPRITLEQIEQEIDLAEFFPGLDFSEERAFKEALGQAIIDHIVERTEKGDGMKISQGGSGKPVRLKAPYSDEYADSLEFRAADKKKNKINMTLTGDMLASVDVIDTKGDLVKIGIEDDDQIPKAYNHNVGDTVPERPWFGISKSELRQILSDFQPDIAAIERRQAGEETIEDTAVADRQSQKIRAMDFFEDDDDV